MKPQAYKFQTVIPQPFSFSYWVFLPKEHGRERNVSWPLLLYLHGASDRGDDPGVVLTSGLPSIVARAVDFPFILLCPQCPTDTWWSDHLSGLDILIKDACDRFAVDPERILVSGSSMGGYGVWHLGVTFPDRFAGLVPLCGGGTWFYGFPHRVRVLKSTPVWVFHGEKDPIIPPRESVGLVNELKEVGGDVHLTIVPNAGHDIWRVVYRMPDLTEWMLARRRLPG